jgi:hypothetical protein
MAMEVIVNCIVLLCLVDVDGDSVCGESRKTKYRRCLLGFSQALIALHSLSSALRD